jgi:flavin reductase (DIM6/NTAB) family NADH-FMN oxidoreductase RutF
MHQDDDMTESLPTLDWFGQKLDYPMFIVTASADAEKSGCLVGFATQCSVHPIRFAVFISKRNHTHGVAGRTPALAIHVVPPEEMDLARLFGGETGDETDKFARCAHRPGPLGSPILESCPNWCEGPIVASLDAGDHNCFIVEPRHGGSTETVDFLSFDHAQVIEPGHEA